MTVSHWKDKRYLNSEKDLIGMGQIKAKLECTHMFTVLFTDSDYMHVLKIMAAGA